MRSLKLLLGISAGLVAREVAGQTPTVFVDVNIISMVDSVVLTRHAVVVREGRIVEILHVDSIAVTDNATVIDGAGAFLIPGLADMHVHFLGDPDELLLYLANGVTTVRDLSGEPIYLDWREEISRGDRPGPNLIVSSPIINRPQGGRVALILILATIGAGLVGFVTVDALVRRVVGSVPSGIRLAVLGSAIAVAYGGVRYLLPFPDFIMGRGTEPHDWVWNARDAARAVRQAAPVYDLVKLYENLTPREFEAAVKESARLGVRSVGHPPLAMTMDQVLESGLDELAHLYFLVTESIEPDSALDRRRRMQELVDRLAEVEMDITSTLMPLPALLNQLTDSAGLWRQVLPYHTADARSEMRGRHREAWSDEDRATLESYISWSEASAAAVLAADVPLVLGTDVSPVFGLAGFSMPDELEDLVRAGLTPFEALRTATVNAGRIDSSELQWGTIESGGRADLVLVRSNPLINVAAVRQLVGVMVAGRWYDDTALSEMLEEVVRRRS